MAERWLPKPKAKGSSPFFLGVCSLMVKIYCS